MTSSETEDMIDVRSEAFDYLDSVDNWLTSDPKAPQAVTNGVDSDIFEWIKNAFSNEKSRGSHKNLTDKLDELKLTNPSVDSRTFTRHKRNLQKRQSLFNGAHMSTLCSPVNEDEYSSPETNDRTFEVTSSARKSMNGTFVKAADSTFTLPNEELNNMEDVEKMAKRQEDSLRQSCSNGWSTPPQGSSPRNETFTRINSNTLTKSRDPERRAQMESQYNHYMNGKDQHFCEDGLLSPEDTFHQNARISSTPLVSKTYSRNTAQDVFREPVVPSIMPPVSNLKSHSRYGPSKIGRSEPNLPKLRFGSTNQTLSSRTSGIPANNSLIHAKAPSDSRLLQNGLRHPLSYNQRDPIQPLGRATSPPPPSQSQQLLNRKVAVEEGVNRLGTTTANATNLCRKSTFRVRDYAINSEESLKENGNDQCLTNTSASTVGYQTNKSDHNSVQRNVSKIPGPKTIR